METLTFNNKENKQTFDAKKFAIENSITQKLFLEFDRILFKKGQDYKDQISLSVKFTGPNNYQETIDSNPITLGNFENPNDKYDNKVLLFHHFINEIPQVFDCQTIEFAVKSEKNIAFEFDLVYKVEIQPEVIFENGY